MPRITSDTSWMKTFFDDAKRQIIAELSQAAPVGKSPEEDHVGPRLKDSFYGQTEGHKLTIYSGSPVYQYVVKGTGPHQILPIRAMALRFESAGEVVFSKVVNHPGTKANDFPGKLTDKIKATTRGMIRDRYRKSFKLTR